LKAKLPPIPWEQVQNKRSTTKKKAGLLIDLRRCVGCHACSVACKTEYQAPLGQFRMRTRYLQHQEKKTLNFLPMLCMQCTDAPCLKACDSKALVKREDGVIVVNEQKCSGDKACISACPYGAIYLNPDTQKAEKCDLCTHRTDLGMEPACVNVCPTQAIQYGDWADDKSTMVQTAKKHELKVMQKSKGTKPQVSYIGLEGWMEQQAKSVQLQPGENEMIYEQGKK